MYIYHICQQNQRANIREPIQEKPILEYPFQIVSSDFFTFKGNDYLLFVDIYSGFFYFKQLQLKMRMKLLSRLNNSFQRMAFRKS